MGQKQSQAKSGDTSRAGVTSRSRSATAASEGTSVDAENNKARDLSGLLSDAPKQVEALASLPTVPCALGAKPPLSEDLGNNNSIPAAHAITTSNATEDSDVTQSSFTESSKILSEEVVQPIQAEKLTESLPFKSPETIKQLVREDLSKSIDSARKCRRSSNESMLERSVRDRQRKRRGNSGLGLEGAKDVNTETNIKYIPNIKPTSSFSDSRTKSKPKITYLAEEIEATVQNTKEKEAAVQKSEEKEAAVQKSEVKKTAVQKSEEREAAVQKSEEKEADVQKSEVKKTAVQKSKEKETAVQKSKEKETAVLKSKEKETAVQKTGEKKAADQRRKEKEAIVQRSAAKVAAGQNTKKEKAAVQKSAAKETFDQKREEQKAPIQRSRKRVDNKTLEEKVRAASTVYDAETTSYIEELCELNNTATQITEDNRVRYVVEDEVGHHESSTQPKYIYSNVIFFPDKSKGATPKRYGPKRLGTLHRVDTEDSQRSSDSESEESSNTRNNSKTIKSNIVVTSGDSENVKEQNNRSITSQISVAGATCESAGYGNDSVKKDEIKQEDKKSPQNNKLGTEDTKVNPDDILEKDLVKEIKVEYCKSSNDRSSNNHPAQKSNKDLEVSKNLEKESLKVIHKDLPKHDDQCCKPSGVTSLTAVSGEHDSLVASTGNQTLEVDTDIHISQSNEKTSTFSLTDSECAASGKQTILKMNISPIKTDSLRSKCEEKSRNKKVNISQNTVHMSYRVPVRRAIDDLQNNIAPDVDWSKLRSRQACYASHLKSSRTNPGQDNRMALEFDLRIYEGSLDSLSGATGSGSRGKSSLRELSLSESESDFNSVVNDFDSDEDDDNDHVEAGNGEKEEGSTGTDYKVGDDVIHETMSDLYSKEIIEKFGTVVSCLRRRKTNIEDDNRIVIEEGEAVCVEFDDEDENSSTKSEDSDISTDFFNGKGDDSSIDKEDESDSDQPTSPEADSSSEDPFGLFRDPIMSMFGGENSGFRSFYENYLEHITRLRVSTEDSSQREEAASREHQLKGIERFSRISRTRENREDIQKLLRREASGKKKSQSSSPPIAGDEGGLEIELAEDSISISDQSSVANTSFECLDVEESAAQETVHSDEGLVFMEEDIWQEVITSEVRKAICERPLPSNSRVTLLCIDTSASMMGKPWQDMEQALTEFVSGLEDSRLKNNVQEHVGVVIFGHETRIALHLTNNYQQVLELFGNLSPDGCSPLAVGLSLCIYPYMMKELGKCCLSLNGIPVSARIILFTDGHPTPVDVIQGSDRFSEKIHAKAKETVLELLEDPDFKLHIDCVPVSETADLEFLESLSTPSGGRTVPLADVAELSYNTYSHYIAAHVGGPMLEAGDNKVDVKIFEKLVWTIYPKITTKQLTEVTEIIKLEVERREEIDEEEEDNLEADMTLEKEGLLPLGTRVTKGPDFVSEWTEDEENMIKFDKGVVISHRCSKPGHVLVEWDNGFKVPLRYGHDNAFDIMTDETYEAPACNIDDPIKIGLQVRRGPDWQFGNQDGGSDQLGTIYGIQSNGEVLVRWPNGNVGNYRYKNGNTYDVLISDPVDPFGRELYTAEMNRRNQICC